MRRRPPSRSTGRALEEARTAHAALDGAGGGPEEAPRAVEEPAPFEEIVGKSAAMRTVFRLIERVAPLSIVSILSVPLTFGKHFEGSASPRAMSSAFNHLSISFWDSKGTLETHYSR